MTLPLEKFYNNAKYLETQIPYQSLLTRVITQFDKQHSAMHLKIHGFKLAKDLKTCKMYFLHDEKTYVEWTIEMDFKDYLNSDYKKVNVK